MTIKTNTNITIEKLERKTFLKELNTSKNNIKKGLGGIQKLGLEALLYAFETAQIENTEADPCEFLNMIVSDMTETHAAQFSKWVKASSPLKYSENKKQLTRTFSLSDNADKDLYSFEYAVLNPWYKFALKHSDADIAAMFEVKNIEQRLKALIAKGKKSLENKQVAEGEEEDVAIRIAMIEKLVQDMSKANDEATADKLAA